ncbi:MULTISPECIES: transcriptional regulator [unclassified Pseudonocardia]|uniref:transcriptional regulator n=1 Tax=unclassified Pseudonocardia TaxID=2619320 RepID=UPI000760F070|nr:MULTISPECIES: transcriptional regulator [unclassified Pseudonocardia]OLM17247.1 putative DNA-binding protein [Pseudonocardia sp. Ae707_Ps1]
MDDRPGDQVAGNRARQREIYGEPLGERVRRLTSGLGITQARLASALGLSPAMLSQLSGARRVKIGDPAVLGRMVALDRRVARGPVPPGEIETLLDRVRSGSAVPWGPVPAGDCRCGAAGPGLAGPDRLPGGAPVVPGAPGASGAPVVPVRTAVVPHPRRPAASAPTADDALRGVSAPARLVAAAAELDPSFPEIADVLRRAAASRR